MESKRRLPILQSAGEADADPARPGWQWVAFGALAIFVLWLPLAAGAEALAIRLPASSAGADARASLGRAIAFATASALALGLAAVAGGFLVGRWGGRGVGIREATLAGLSAAIVAVGASWWSFGFAPGGLLVVAIAVPFAALGGSLGRRVA